MNFLTRNQDTEFHFMVDIETLDTGSNAAITEIGAMARNANGINEFFHTECIDPQGDRSPETIQWRVKNNLHWMSQAHAAPQDISIALSKFTGWITDKAQGRVPILWCKGTDFDAVILNNAFTRNILVRPWKYNDINDIRTLLRLFPQFKIPKELVKHNGLEDAILQYTCLEKLAYHIANLELAHGIYKQSEKA